MEFLENIDWPTVLVWIASAVTIASVIVKLTPTPKDDTVLAKIIDVLKKIGLYKKGT